MRTTLIAVIIALGATLAAQDCHWRGYTHSTGARDMAVQASLVWIASSGGLTRINAHTGESTCYTRDNSGLPANGLFSVCASPTGDIWVAAGAQLTSYDGDQWTTYGEEGASSIDHLAADSQGNVWLSVTLSDRYGRLCCFNPDTVLVYTPDNSGLPSAYIADIAIGSGDIVWLATSAGLVRFDGTNWTTYNTSNSGLPSNEALCVAVVNNANVWVGTDAGLGHYFNNAWTTYTTANSDLPDNEVTALAVGDQNRLLIGTASGVPAMLYGSNGWVLYEDFPTLGHNIQDLTEDTAGNVWLGAAGCDAYCYDGTGWTAFTLDNSDLPTLSVNCAGADPQGRLVLGTWDCGLVTWDGETWTQMDSTNSGLPHSNVLGFGYDDAGDLWAYTYLWEYDRLSHYDGAAWTHYTAADVGVSAFDIDAIATACGGDLFFGGNVSASLLCHSSGEWSQLDLPFDDSYCPNIHNFAVDSQDRLWCAVSFRGFACYDGAIWTTYTDELLTYYPTSCLAIDSQDVLWLGTGIGLGRWDGDSLTYYDTTNSPLPTNSIDCQTIDANDRVWVGTYHGAACFDGTSWTVFTTADSPIADNNVNQIVIDGEGTKWFVTWQGISAYNEDWVSAPEQQTAPLPVTSLRAYPNPFNPSTTVAFSLSQAGQTELAVYNIRGQRVRTLLNARLAAGEHTAVWNGRDDTGRAVAGGVYFCRLCTGAGSQMRKMLLLK